MNSFKTFLLMSMMMIFFLAVGFILGGESGLVIALLFSIVLNFGSYWFSDKIILSIYGAHEIQREQHPQLFSIVEELSFKAEIPMPRVFIMENQSPNAFATGRNPQNGAVAITTGLLKILDRGETQGVIAHELSHIKNRDILVGTIAATLVGTISAIAQMAGFAAMFGGRSDDDDSSWIADLALIILAPIIATLIQLAISRSREYLADESAAKLTNNPLGLASALNKLTYAGEKIPMHNAGPASAHMFIVNPLSGRRMMKLFSTHPPLEERIIKLELIAKGRI